MRGDCALQRDELCVVGLGEVLNLFVQALAIGPIEVIVAVFASGRPVDLDAATHRLATEFDEFLDVVRRLIRLVLAFRGQQILPRLHQPLDLVKVLDQRNAELLGLGAVARHIDAARIHDHGIDHRIDLLADKGALRGALHLTDLPVEGLHRH